tara:strand:+ start:435 stop:1226 length:792 start_codon:yes stop_codon:yes gene_type:complete
MALPFLIPLLVGGALLGANVARNKDENILEGALKGALLGGGASTLGGALGLGTAGAVSSTAGTGQGALGFGEVMAKEAALKSKIASDAAASAATIVPRTNAASTVGVDSLFSSADLGLNVNPATGASLNIPTDSFNAFQAQNVANKAALDSAVGKINITNPLTEKISVKLTPTEKLLATAKDKPLETAYFASTVGSALSPPPVTGGGAVAPFTPGSVQPTPTVDESIGEMPMFVPKPLFDDMIGRSPEEMILLEQQMMARGLV